MILQGEWGRHSYHRTDSVFVDVGDTVTIVSLSMRHDTMNTSSTLDLTSTVFLFQLHLWSTQCVRFQKVLYNIFYGPIIYLTSMLFKNAQLFTARTKEKIGPFLNRKRRGTYGYRILQSRVGHGTNDYISSKTQSDVRTSALWPLRYVYHLIIQAY